MQSDNYWLNTRTPAITYGLRGLSYYKVTITGPARDLHSGVFGRTVYEPMTDLVKLLSTLVTSQGDILIKGVDEMVPPADEEEKYAFALIRKTSSGLANDSLEPSTRDLIIPFPM